MLKVSVGSYPNLLLTCKKEAIHEKQVGKKKKTNVKTLKFNVTQTVRLSCIKWPALQQLPHPE